MKASKSSQQAGTGLSNKMGQQRMPDGGKSKFRQGEGPDQKPSGNMGKNMGQMEPKQTNFRKGKVIGKDPVSAGKQGTSGPVSSSAYSRSGGQIA